MPTQKIPTTKEIADYIKFNDVQKLEEALKNGLSANYELPHHKYSTLLQYASSYGRLEICQLLIRAQAKIDQEYMISPILLAMQNGHKHVAEFLILCGGKKIIALSQAIKQDKSLLPEIVKLSPKPYIYLFGCICQNDEPLILQLLKANRDCSKWKQQAAQLLCLALRLKLSEQIIEQMLKCDYPVQLEDINDRTCLYWASVNNLNKNLIDKLIKKGADPEIALQQAIIDNKDDAVSLLKSVIGCSSKDTIFYIEKTPLYQAQQGSSAILSLLYDRSEIEKCFIETCASHQYVAATSLLFGMGKDNDRKRILSDAFKNKKSVAASLLIALNVDHHKVMQELILNREIKVEELTNSELNALTQIVLLLENKEIFDILKTHQDFEATLLKQLYNAVDYLDTEQIKNIEKQVEPKIFSEYIIKIKNLAQENKKPAIIRTLFSKKFITEYDNIEIIPSPLEELSGDILIKILQYTGIKMLPSFLHLSKTIHHALKNQEFISKQQEQLMKSLNSLHQLEALRIELENDKYYAIDLNFDSFFLRALKMLPSVGTLGCSIFLGAISGNLFEKGIEPYKKLLEECKRVIARYPRADISCGYLVGVHCRGNDYECSGLGTAKYYREEVAEWWNWGIVLSSIAVVFFMLYILYHIGLLIHRSCYAVNKNIHHKWDLYGIFDKDYNDPRQNITQKSQGLLEKLEDYPDLKEIEQGMKAHYSRRIVSNVKSTVKKDIQFIEANMRFFSLPNPERTTLDLNTEGREVNERTPLIPSSSLGRVQDN